MTVTESTVGIPTQLILTREAAKIIGCGMSNVRWLAHTGRLPSITLGPRAIGFVRADVERYKETQAIARAKAHAEGRHGRGREPMGFSGH